MANLHTLNTANLLRWQSCRITLSSGDVVLLIEEAVCHFQTIQSELPAGVQLFCLKSDLESHGLSCSAAQTIDYAQWVRLACQFERNMSW